MDIKQKINRIGEIKYKMQNDISAIAPIIWLIVIAGSVVAGLGVYNITQRPDITYNITDTGFSFAGMDVSWIFIIGLFAIVIFAVLFLFRKKPQTNN